MDKIKIFLIASLFISLAGGVSAQENLISALGSPELIYSKSGDITVDDPEMSRAFYDNLKGQPRIYLINSDVGFELYVNILVPAPVNISGRYSARVISLDRLDRPAEEQVAEIDGGLQDWQEFYDSAFREYYLRGPELIKQFPAGKYKIEVYSKESKGEYVLSIGREKINNIQSFLNLYWQLPLLKKTFFNTSILQFFFTPIAIAGIGALGVILILLALINYLVGFIMETIKHNQAKTLLLTSGGMLQMKDEIIKLLQKPAYDVEVAFITTATKPQESADYIKKDWEIMKEGLGFNMEEIDIEGKTEHELMKSLEFVDIIFVAGGNTFYLLKMMRQCNFEKVIRKLLKQGKVYIGVSAGSIVAGRTIQTAEWLGDNNVVGLKKLKGLNLVPFDIFVHYNSNYTEIIKQKIKNPKNRLKNLRILTDDQAILVQGKEVDLIGEGEAVVI